MLGAALFTSGSRTTTTDRRKSPAIQHTKFLTSKHQFFLRISEETQLLSSPVQRRSPQARTNDISLNSRFKKSISSVLLDFSSRAIRRNYFGVLDNFEHAEISKSEDLNYRTKRSEACGPTRVSIFFNKLFDFDR